MKAYSLLIAFLALAVLATGLASAYPRGEDCERPPEYAPGGPMEGQHARHMRKGERGKEMRGGPMEGPPERHMRKGERGKRMEGWHPGMDKRDHVERHIRKLREDDPEEFRRLMQLRRDNPGEFRKEVGKRFKQQFKETHPEAYERMKRQKKIHKSLRELRRKYDGTDEDDERKEIKGEMKELLGQSFDLKLEAREQEIQYLEQRTKKLRKKLRKRNKNKNEMLKLRLKGMIDGPETVRW